MTTPPSPTPPAPSPSGLRGAPVVVQGLVAVATLAALALPWLLRERGVVHPQHPAWLTVACVLLLSVLNVELGRLLEGDLAAQHRPHKALSAWAFVSALLLPLPFLPLVVAFTHAHARWRGQPVALWRWVGSAAVVALAGTAAAVVAVAVDPDPNLMHVNGGLGLVEVLVATATFLVAETALFAVTLRVDRVTDDLVRPVLTSRTFYLTEASMLLMGGLSAAVWTAGAWFLLLLVPVYALAQRAASRDSWRERADVDDKTGLLRFESWRVLAEAEQARQQAKGRAWSVAFLDLDHFKGYNDTWGHLAGDAALGAVARELEHQLRSRDVIGRFGGEEFCVFLPDTGGHDATIVAERLRRAIAGLELPQSRATTTTSVGVVTFEVGAEPPLFIHALTAADRMLFEAKMAGRDRVRSHVVGLGEAVSVTPPPQRVPGA